jgi:carbamoyltransferase
MNILGISAGYHDAAVSVVNTQGDIVFAGHSERYSKQKNDADFCQGLVDEVAEYGPETVAYYERPWVKQTRQWYSGQGIDWNKLTTKQILRKQLADRGQQEAFVNENLNSISLN